MDRGDSVKGFLRRRRNTLGTDTNQAMEAKWLRVPRGALFALGLSVDDGAGIPLALSGGWGASTAVLFLIGPLPSQMLAAAYLAATL